MPESTDTHVVTELPKQSLRSRLLTKKNLKRGAIVGTIVMGGLWVKSQLTGSASVSADLHVETDETDNN